MNYNLLDEHWIPVLYRNGNWDRVGIRQALEEAGQIRQIAATNPMDRVAILRLLLALLYWCRGTPGDDAGASLGDVFPPEWFSKLDENKECFNLLGEGKRFYQYRVSGTPKKLTANYLIHEVPTGTNKWHFRHSTDSVDGLCPACCAMGLLRLPAFATSAGRGKPPGINAKPPIYALPIAGSLAETLRLSWQQVSQLGSPAWENPALQLPATGEVPLLMGLTWLPRRVWLDDPDEPETACVLCGRIGRLIRMCVFAGIGSTRTEADEPRREWRDPHVIYEESPKGDVTSRHASDALGASDAGAGQWAKVMAGVLLAQEANEARNVWVVGFSTVQNDKYLEATECLMPCCLSRHHDEESIAKFEGWQKEGKQFEKRIGRPKVNANAAIAAVRPHVEDRVFAKAAELILGSDEAWGRAGKEYRPMMRVIAQSLSPGFTTAALQQRQHIALVAPDMRTRKEPVSRPGRKKGGDK